MAVSLDSPLALVGFMASGKSHVGRLIATEAGLPFIDTDQEIVKTLGMPIPRIFAELGEARFREEERRALERALAETAIIAAGGGAFLRRKNRDLLLQRSLVVWLDVGLDEIRRRLAMTRHERPLWPSDPLDQRLLWSRRRATYALASIRIDSSRLSPEEVAERVLAAT